MNLVVTGAKGFLGSVLSHRAVEMGHTVLALDDESRGRNNVTSYRVDGGPSGGASEGPQLRYVKHDCRGGIGEVLQTSGLRPDAVVHFAAGTGSLDRPIEQLRGLNVEMMKRVYQDAVAWGAKAFLFPVTSLALEVPDSPYVQSKEEALAWLLEADVTNRIALPVRFFNVIGAYRKCSEFRANEVHLIPALVDCSLWGVPLVINGDDYPTWDGTPSRDFVNVLDLVEYVLLLLLMRVTGAARPPGLLREPLVPASDGAIWLGTGHSTTVKELIALFCQHVMWVDYTIGPRRPFDCWGLTVDPQQQVQFARARGLLTPPWVGLRDEALVLIARTKV